MSYPYTTTTRFEAAGSIYRLLSAFPIAAFSLTVVTDIVYWRTENLMWLHFSEWLLFTGIVFGVVAGVVRLFQVLFGGLHFAWPYYVAGLFVLLLAALNNFLHTSDGITAVIPYGLTVSVLTVVVMCATGLLGRMGVRYA